jgi:MFS family permease
MNRARKSLQALDWMNFCMADMQMAIGAFIAIYLTSARHWNPAQAGLVVAAQSIATMLAQPGIGALVDWSNHKKVISAIAAGLVAAGILLVPVVPSLFQQVLVQVLIGVSVAAFPPLIGAVSLGIVGNERLPQRIGRNEMFNHSGKVAMALLAGALAACFGQQWFFYTAFAFGIGTILASGFIHNGDINNQQARAADVFVRTVSVTELFQDRRIPIFLASVVLFHFANACLLQLVTESLAHGKDGHSSFYVSACIIVAQCIMIPVAWLASRLTEVFGRKPLFLLCYAIVALRALLFAFGGHDWYLISVQSLDGVAAAIFGVLWTLISSDLARGTGRFNFLQGVVASSWYIGAFLSNVAGGYIANRMGFQSSFLCQAGIAAVGFLFFLVLMPETKDSIRARRAHHARLGQAAEIRSENAPA